MRALVVTRLSRLVDESTSAERQQQACREVCEQNGWEVVGVAEDLNVSAGKTSPFQRPELSRWIGDGASDPGRMYEIDVIVFWRLDRLVRSVTQLADVIRWAEKFNVTLKSATEPHFDLSSSMGKVIATMVASFAEMELEAIRERISADQQHRVRSGLYRGGRTPFGYKSEPLPDGSGKRLVQDPEHVKVVRRLVDGIMSGRAANDLAYELNQEGLPCSTDLNLIRDGKEPKGGTWQGGHIKRLLLSPALRGLVETSDPLLDSNGKAVVKNGRKQYSKRYVLRNEDGTPVQRAEPIITSDEYAKLKKILDARAVGQRPNRATVSLLTGVLFCGACGSIAYKMKGSPGRRETYRCRAKQYKNSECSNPVATVDFEWVNSTIENLLLELLNGSVKRERVWDPGTENDEQQAELEESLDSLVNLLGQSPYIPGSSAYDALSKRIEAIGERIDELKQTEGIPAGWHWNDTEQSFSGWWNSLPLAQKNQFLKDSGVRIEYLHDEDRKRGQNPNLSIELNLETLNGEYAPGQTMENILGTMEETPSGHSLVIRDGDVRLENRA